MRAVIQWQKKKTETGLLRTLICLFGHDGTHIQPTHHPGPLYPSFPTPCVALSALPCHTHFISGLVVACSMSSQRCTCALLRLCCRGFLHPSGRRCEHQRGRVQGFQGGYW